MDDPNAGADTFSSDFGEGAESGGPCDVEAQNKKSVSFNVLQGVLSSGPLSTSNATKTLSKAGMGEGAGKFSSFRQEKSLALEVPEKSGPSLENIELQTEAEADLREFELQVEKSAAANNATAASAH